MSPRGPAIEGMGESSDRPREDGLARVTELPAGGPHDAASSSSSPAGEHSPCVLLIAVLTLSRHMRWSSDSWLSPQTCLVMCCGATGIPKEAGPVSSLQTLVLAEEN